jgi:hypothetical protein
MDLFDRAEGFPVDREPPRASTRDSSGGLYQHNRGGDDAETALIATVMLNE